MNHREILKMRSEFLGLTHTEALCDLLGINSLGLYTLTTRPPYFVYQIPKSDGSFRLIEDPAPRLKKPLQMLQLYLQCVYHTIRTDAAFGFLIRSDREKQPRNIYTNARSHIGCRYLLKIDLEDFFHQISRKRVFQTLEKAPFIFSGELCQSISGLASFKGRLPMGSPSSPIFSNLCSIDLDKVLMQFCGEQDIRYTRFADDMCFSSAKDWSEYKTTSLLALIGSCGWSVNKQKSKLFGPRDDKEVTGLLVGMNDIYLSKKFIRTLRQETERYSQAHEAASLMAKAKSSWLREYRDKLDGMIRFAAGADDSADAPWRKYADRIDRVSSRMSAQEVLSWRDFPYI